MARCFAQHIIITDILSMQSSKTYRVLGLLFLLNYPNLEDPLSPWFDPHMDEDEFRENVTATLRGEDLPDVCGQSFPVFIVDSEEQPPTCTDNLDDNNTPIEPDIDNGDLTKESNVHCQATDTFPNDNKTHDPTKSITEARYFRNESLTHTDETTNYLISKHKIIHWLFKMCTACSIHMDMTVKQRFHAASFIIGFVFWNCAKLICAAVLKSHDSKR